MDFDFSAAEPLSIDERLDAALELTADLRFNMSDEDRPLYMPDSGATDRELAELEETLGMKLPEEHEALLRRWRFFRFFDGSFDSGRIYGLGTERPRLPTPWRIGSWLVVGQFSGYSNTDFLVVDARAPDGRVSMLDMWNGQAGVDDPAEPAGAVVEWAPSISLAFYRMGVELAARREWQRRAAEEVERRSDGGVEFRVRYEDPDTRQFFCPCVEDADQDWLVASLVARDAVVIADEKIRVVFDYPLSHQVFREYTHAGGFTRLDLLRCIAEGYREIYAEEEAAVGDPGNVEGLMNREKSEGPHGIWGHRPGELFVEILVYHPEDGVVVMQIGS